MEGTRKVYKRIPFKCDFFVVSDVRIHTIKSNDEKHLFQNKGTGIIWEMQFQAEART